jgi:transcriptional regulator with XRE-family HTH domain
MSDFSSPEKGDSTSPQGNESIDQQPTSEEVEPIAKRINRLREEKGLSQAKLAKAIGIEPSHLSRMLKGERPLQAIQLEKIAKELGVDLEQLTSGTTAEGMSVAVVEAHQANKELMKQLAAQTAENEVLKAQLKLAKKTENSHLREIDDLKQELKETRTQMLSLQQRPTQEQHNNLFNSHVQLANDKKELEQNLAQHIDNHQVTIKYFESLLRQAYEQVEINYQACMDWKNIAEKGKQEAKKRGVALKAGAATVVGIGIASLLAKKTPRRQ